MGLRPNLTNIVVLGIFDNGGIYQILLKQKSIQPILKAIIKQEKEIRVLERDLSSGLEIEHNDNKS